MTLKLLSQYVYSKCKICWSNNVDILFINVHLTKGSIPLTEIMCDGMYSHMKQKGLDVVGNASSYRMIINRILTQKAFLENSKGIVNQM